MKLFRKLFAEKILRYYEGTEAGIKMIKSFPVIRKLVKDDAFGEKSKSRAFVGTMAQIFNGHTPVLNVSSKVKTCWQKPVVKWLPRKWKRK